MNPAPQKSFYWRIALPLMAGTFFIAAFLLVGLHAVSLRSNLPDPFTPYNPVTFGIPEILAGYRIVTVQTLENTACMSPNTIRLTIQAVEPSADNPMVPAAGGDIIFEVKKIYPDVRWELQYIMPGPYDRDQLAPSMQKWNEAMKDGCIILGGPMPTITNTPDV